MYGGLLGVGKTTVIRQLLQHGYEAYRVVIIENEIGTVNLDAAFLGQSGVTIREITGGCVCCTVRGRLGEAIREIAAELHPDFIVMEPSGAADIRTVQAELRSIREVRPGRAVLIVNAKKVSLLLQIVGDFFLDQIRCAEQIYLSRAEQLSEKTLASVKESLLKINPALAFVDKPVGALHLADFPLPEEPETKRIETEDFRGGEPSDLFAAPLVPRDLPIRNLEEPKRFMPGKKDNNLYTWDWKLPGNLNEKQIETVREAIADTEHLAIWRAKGILRSKEGTVHKIDYVFGDISEEVLENPDAIAENVIVLIGKKIDRPYLDEVASLLGKMEDQL